MVICAVPHGARTAYIALLVRGGYLYSATARIMYSVRLNICNLKGLHLSMQSNRRGGEAETYVRHPSFDSELSSLKPQAVMKISEMSWGRQEHVGYPSSTIEDAGVSLNVRRLLEFTSCTIEGPS